MNHSFFVKNLPYFFLSLYFVPLFINVYRDDVSVFRLCEWIVQSFIWMVYQQ